MSILDEALGNEQSSILDEALIEHPRKSVTTVQPQEQGWWSTLGNDLKDMGSSVANRFDKITSADSDIYKTGTTPQHTLRAIGQEAALVGDVVGGGLRTLYHAITPDKIEQWNRFIANKALDATGAKEFMGEVGTRYDQFREANPNISRDVEALANIGSVAPWGKAATLTKDLISPALGATAKATGITLKEVRNVIKDTGKFIEAIRDEGLQKGLGNTVDITRHYSQRAQIVPNRVKNSTDMKKFYEAEDTAVQQIIKDKDELVFSDKTGNVIKKQLPETVEEWNQAIPQVKDKVMNRIEKLLKDTDEAGGRVSTQPVLDTINTIKNSDLYRSMLLHKQYDDVVTKIDDMAARYKQKGYMTPSEVNADIQVLNKLVGSQVDPLADIVMFDILKTQRNSLDDVVSNLQGKGFRELKKTWGALKEIEPRVAQKANALSREEGRLNFWDIASLAEGGMGLVSLNPKIVAMAGATKLAKETVKWYNNPNRYVKNMFQKVEDKMNPEYKSKLFNLRQAKRY